MSKTMAEGMDAWEYQSRLSPRARAIAEEVDPPPRDFSPGKMAMEQIRRANMRRREELQPSATLQAPPARPRIAVYCQSQYDPDE